MNAMDAGLFEEMDGKVRAIRKLTEELLQIGSDIEAVRRNGERMLASIRMIELNVCDAREVLV
jgi:hypothetical protein